MTVKHLAIITIILSPAVVFGQGTGANALNNLYRPHEGRVIQFSSHDTTGSNADFRPIASGDTLTLVDYQGSGVLHRWWLTIAPRNNQQIQRHLIVLCYWDGEKDPSVKVPVTDFFGMGFGLWKDYISMPLNMTSGGYNSYWPMPFRKSARIEIVNLSDLRVSNFYYNIDIETEPAASMPEDLLYFHAQFRKQITRKNQPVTLLETTGRGHYVGTLLSMQSLKGNAINYLEGDERVFVDGESEPGIIGTGTEDYFNSGWYFDTGEYSAPYHGVTIKDTDKGWINAYRWHIQDPIPFKKSLRFTIEHGGENTHPHAEYTSVAYWYQTHPHPEFPPLPGRLMPEPKMKPPKIEGMHEAEALKNEASVTEGSIQVQGMSGFKGTWSMWQQLWWLDGNPGDRMTLPIEVNQGGTYSLSGYFTQAPDYGQIQCSLNGEVLKPKINGYQPEVKATGNISLGEVKLNRGRNTLTIEITGKDPKSTGYLVGIDGFTWSPVH